MTTVEVSCEMSVLYFLLLFNVTGHHLLQGFITQINGSWLFYR